MHMNDVELLFINCKKITFNWSDDLKKVEKAVY